MPVLSTTAILAGLLGCSGARDGAARRSWMVEVLVDENMVWMSRDPDLLAAKYSKMAADPYNYMRGTAGLYLQDWSRPGTERAATDFVRSTEAAEVLLVIDPHPGNTGTFLSGGAESDGEPALLYEFNDFDGSTFGPYLLDVRRAAAGLMMLMEPLEGCDEACRLGVVQASVERWIEVIQDPEGDRPLYALEGEILDDLLDDAEEKGLERKRYNKYTERLEGAEARTLVLDEELDEDGKGLLALTDVEREQLDRLMAAWSGPDGLRVLDAARRYGQGVSSLPATRYVVLWDLGEDGDEDDGLLNVREVLDPPAVPGVVPAISGLYDDNADRIVSIPRALWSVADADPNLGAAADGAQTFKGVSWGSWYQGVDHEKVTEDWSDGDLDVGDLDGLAEAIGEALAMTHRRAPTASGGRAIDAIRGDVEGREAAFLEERLRDAEADHAQNMYDYDLFLRALELYGPCLGADGIEGDL